MRLRHQYEPRWRAATRPAKVRLTAGERRRLGVSVSWAILSPRGFRLGCVLDPPLGGWQAVEVWVTERLSVEPPCRPPAAAHARGALWSAGILHVPTRRTVQRKRRRRRSKLKARRGWA